MLHTRHAHLAILPARGDVTHHAVSEVTTIGSSPDADIFLPDPELAAVHARIEAHPSGYVLVREAQPLLVNGHRAHKHLLEPYDSIVVGKNTLSFRPGLPPAPRNDNPNLDAIRRLHAFARRVLGHEDPETVAAQLVADLLALTGAQRGTIVRFGADDDPSSIVTATQGSFSGPEIAYSRTLLARMQRKAKGILVDDAGSDPELRDAQSLAGVPSFAAAVVPMFSEGRLLGALYVSGKSLHASSLDLLELYAGHAVMLFESERRTRVLEAKLDDPADADDASLIVGSSPPMLSVKKLVAKVATSRAPLLITGETGTGKEVVAREIHRLSPRARGPFVAVNCGSIPHELLASELFGHVRGAFSQAHKDRLGYFRSADGGTLLLDEIGEMPLAQQVALLRVLAEERVTPVGADASTPIDVRVLFATNRSLEAEVAAGRFRQDLFFRIAVVTLALPPLRERGGDVLRLAEHFLRHHAREQRAPDVRFSDPALAAIRRGPWEGNVRQLDAAVRRGVLLRENDLLTPEDLGLDLADDRATEEGELVVRPLAMARDEYLRGYVRSVVDRMGGNRTAAAQALLVTPRTIFKYIEE